MRVLTTMMGSIAAGILAGACGGPEEDGELYEREATCSADWLAAAVTVSGRVVDGAGEPVAAELSAQGQPAATDGSGAFSLQLGRGNALLSVQADGYRPVQVAVDTSQDDVELGAIALRRADEGVTMSFGGDVMFGRRFLDPEGDFDRYDMPTDNEDALIRVSDPRTGTEDVLRSVAPLLALADISAVNLETVVTLNPSTAHATTSIAFFSLPQSIPALTAAGVDYVSLGNNHSFDYLNPGVESTAVTCDTLDLLHSGTGLNADEAFLPQVIEHSGTRYALFSVSGITGSYLPIPLVADEDKGGSASAVDEERVVAEIGASLDRGEVPIVQLHDGIEYNELADPAKIERMALFVRAGTPLLIGHHPHVVQGFRELDGALIVESLGNLVFDSERHETMQSVLLTAQLDGTELLGADVVPLYIEDYAPRPMVGEAASRLLRQMGGPSLDNGVAVVPVAGGARLEWGDEAPEPTLRELVVPLTVDASRQAVLDLRPWLRNNESLHSVQLGADLATADLGEDLLYYGDFEDLDVDGDIGEVTAWSFGEASEPCHCDVHRGAQAMCSTRSAYNHDEALVLQRRRVRVHGHAGDNPQRDLGVLVWSSAEQAGPARVDIRLSPATGSEETEDQTLIELPEGDRPWAPHYADLDLADRVLPSGDLPGAVRLFLRSEPPRRGDAVVRWDSAAIVSWEESDLRIDGEGLDLRTPNAVDFLRIDAPPGSYDVQLVLSRW